VDYADVTVRLTCGTIFFSVGLAVVATGPSGCRRPEPSAAATPLPGTFGGCAAVVALPGGATACELGEARGLRVLVPRDAATPVVRAGQTVLAARAEEAGSSTRLAFDVPREATRITITGRRGSEVAELVIPIAAPPTAASALDAARAARAKGDLAEARAIAERHVRSGNPVERALAESLLARISLAEGRADEAFRLFRSAIASHRAAGRISDAVDDSFALAFALHQRSHRYDEARQALDHIVPELPRYDEGHAREPYYRGILASETGDHRAALASLREAETRASALGMARLARNARAALAMEMLELGRFRAAIQALDALAREPDVKGCERVEIENDRGWAALLAHEAGERADPREPLQRAVAVADCGDAYLRSFALANLARVELESGELAESRAHLEAARAAVKEPRGTERLAWLDLEARLLAREGRPAEALARFDEERSLARATVLREHEWSALVGRADVLLTMGRRAAAAEALLLAEGLIDEMLLLVPLGGGRGMFLAERSRGTRGAIDVLTALGRTAEAAQIARRSRARVLSAVERALRLTQLDPAARSRWEGTLRTFREARATLDREAGLDWKLPASALVRASEGRRERERAARDALEASIGALHSSSRSATATEPGRAGTAASSVEPADDPVAEGDLEILVHPSRVGWMAFFRDAQGTTARPVGDPRRAPAELALDLLTPVAARVRASRRVRVLAYGAWRDVDVHALPFDGAPLVDAVDVDYPMGFRSLSPVAPAAVDARGETRHVVVVGDPGGDLPRARAEAEAVASALPGMRPTLLVGPRATRAALLAALPGTSLFHYAGHGVFAGDEGFESALPLADGSKLSLGDLLVLSPPPTKVVLSGCDAARSEGDAEGLGLAQALVAAGADEVLAPTRPVADELAARLAALLFDGGTVEATIRGERGALAGGLRRASHVLREHPPPSREARPSPATPLAPLATPLDWSAFRVLTR